MKKIVAILVVLLGSFLLISCDKKPVKPEVTEPELIGIENIEIEVGSEFDPLAGITATDATDGDITDKIKVENTVNVNKPATYELVYSVENSLGKKASKKRVVIVTGIGGLSNGDFSDGLEGWTQWASDSNAYIVEYSAEDNKAVIDITHDLEIPNKEWWGVQLSYKKIQLKQFVSYTLEFTVSADKPRYLNYQIQGGGIPGGKAFGEKNLVTITTEEQVISKDFFVKADAEGAELQFALGAFTKDMYGATINEDLSKVDGKVYISNVRIIYGPELENQAPEITANDQYVKLGGNFFPGQGILVVDDRDVSVEYTIKDISEVKFVDTSAKGVYTFEITATDSEGLSTVKTRKVHIASAFDIPSFNDLDENGKPINWSVWFEAVRGGLSVEYVDGVAEVNITKVGDGENLGNIWENKFQLTGLAAFKGSYILSFTAKADLPRPVRVAMEGAGVTNINKDFDLTNEWVTYTFEFEVAADAKEFKRTLQFWFGNFAGQGDYTAASNVLTKVYFKDIVVTEVK